MLWDAAQLAFTFYVGSLFVQRGPAFNRYVESERHLDAAEVRSPMLASEVTLEWDTDAVLSAPPSAAPPSAAPPSAAPPAAALPSAAENGEVAALIAWDESTRVPAPPEPPSVITAFSGLGRRMQAHAATTATTTLSAVAPQPQQPQAPPQGGLEMHAAGAERV